MRREKNKSFILLFGLLLFTSSSEAVGINSIDGYSHITVQQANTHGTPRSPSIHAFLNDHYLTVSFSQDFGQVTIEVTTASGLFVDSVNLLVSTGWQFYIPDEGDYVFTITFADGDEYYGEFTITD